MGIYLQRSDRPPPAPAPFQAAGRGTSEHRGVAHSPPVIRDAIERAGEIVGHEDRAVGQLRDVDRAAEIFAVLGEPAFGERLGLVRRAVLLQAA